MKIRNAMQTRQRIRLEGDPRRGTDSRPIFEALGRSIYSYTVPLASLASSAGASQVRSEATFLKGNRKVVQVVLTYMRSLTRPMKLTALDHPVCES